MDTCIIPGFNITRQLESERIRKPSKETLKHIRVELITSCHTTHVYSPGETVEGVFRIYSTSEKKKINDIFFNDVEITLENRVITSQGLDCSYFSMDDSPKMETFPPMCHDPDKYAFTPVEFPFTFTLPQEHLDDTCSVPGHTALIPSYGQPSRCGLSFHPTSVAGLKPAIGAQLGVQSTGHHRFCNVYYIQAKVKQNILGLDRPYIVFTRSLELNVQNEHCNSGVGNDLPLTKSTSLKLNGITMGKISLQMGIPPPCPLSQGFVLPMDVFFDPLTEGKFPGMSIQYELAQYSIQATQCESPISLPHEGAEGITIQKVCSLHSASVNPESVEWTPSYYHEASYNHHIDLVVPPLEGSGCPSFHSCHLQNIYSLQLKVTFDAQGDNQPIEAKSAKSRWFGRKKTQVYAGVPGENDIIVEVPITVI